MDITQKIQRFYDLASPYLLKLWGIHIHEGYYKTGKESKEKAQEQLISLLAEKAQIKRGESVLDIGCGMGGTSVWLAKKLKCRVVGITISPIQIKIARKFAKTNKVNVNFLLMNAESMKFKQLSDIVWVVGAITHFKDKQLFLQKASALLKPKGRIVIADWMPIENIDKKSQKEYIEKIMHGMLLPSTYPMSRYTNLLIKNNIHMTYAKDISKNVTQTWDIAIEIIKKPALWKLACSLGKDFIIFLKSFYAIKNAFQKKKLIYGIIIGEKI